MGKNIKRHKIEFKTNPCAEIPLEKPFKCNLVAKPRGRKKMTEKFFYNPHKEESGLLIGMDVAAGDLVYSVSSTIGHVTKIVNENTVEIKWEITYG
jgi:hypothetical protein